MIAKTAQPGQWGPPGTAPALFAAGLSFGEVSLAYGPKTVLDRISFELGPGEIICLLGPSGCGKSSLLRLASGIERPSGGRIRMDGRTLADDATFVPPEDRSIGLVFQDFALFPHLTVMGNVLFGLKALDRASADSQAKSALRRVGMEQFANRYPGSLSGGEQQRIALARALATRPSVLLMDEPFSSLDPLLRGSVRSQTLSILTETRASCIIVTHDPIEAMGMANRILLMRQGRLIQVGTPREIFEAPVDLEAARFLGEYNELECTVVNGTADTPFGPVHLNAGTGMEAGRVLLLLRPQCIRLTDGPGGMPGFVSATRYEGEFTFLRLLFRNMETPFWARVRSADAPPRESEQRFIIDPQQVLAYPAD